MGLRPYNWIQYLTLFIVIAMGVVIPIFAWEITGLQHNQSAALRTVLCFSEARTAASSTLTAAQKRQAVGFYEDALASIHARPCP